MYFGQTIRVKAREEYNCVLSTCNHQILPGEVYYGLVVRNRSGTMYTRRAHPECHVLYMEEAAVNRSETIRERRAANRPERDFQLTSEQRRRRQTVLQYVSFARGRLIVAYGAKHPDRIRKAKATLLRHLQEVASGEIGPISKFKFGEDLIELLATGIDPALSAQEARKSDLEADFEYTMSLFDPERAVDVEIVPELPKLDPIREAQLELLRREAQREREIAAAPKWWDDPEQKRLAQERAAVLSAEGDARVAAILAKKREEENEQGRETTEQAVDSGTEEGISARRTENSSEERE